MPYQKGNKYYGSVTGRQLTKRQFTRRKRTVKAIDYAVKGAKVAYKLARLANVEKKHLDTDQTAGFQVGTTAVEHDLTNVSQGDGRSQRHGDSVKPMGITIRGAVTMNSASATTVVRMVIVRGKHTNGTNPSYSSTFDGNSVFAPKSWDNRFHTKVLYDRRFNFSNTGSQQQFFTKYIKLYGHINWNEGTTNEEDGGIYIFFLCDKATNTANVKYHARLTFTDN